MKYLMAKSLNFLFRIFVLFAVCIYLCYLKIAVQK